MTNEDWIKHENLPKHILGILRHKIANMACRIKKPNDYCSRDDDRCLYPRQSSYDQGYVRGFIDALDFKTYGAIEGEAEGDDR